MATATSRTSTRYNTRAKVLHGIEESLAVMRSTRRLNGHQSCVNALEWTTGDGRWLISGGDDRQLLFWDIYNDSATHSARLPTPRGIILSLAVSASNSHVFCAGSWNITGIYRHCLPLSLETSPSTHSSQPSSSSVILSTDNADTINDLSAHPSNENLLLSGGSNCRVLLHDIRKSGGGPVGQVALKNDVSGVRYHPSSDGRFFAVCTSDGGTELYDSRMAFGTEVGKGGVTRYITKATKPGITWLAQPDASSLTFEAEGSLLALTCQGHFPTVYTLDDPYPLAICSSATLPDGSPLPDGQPGYTTAVTMKHGSLRTYGGTTYYAAGSEDFRAYIWKIPPAGQLKEQRRPMTTEEWLSGRSGEGKGMFAYAPNRSTTPLVPENISTPAGRVEGHSSIINTALFHPTLPLLATSGIERFIRLHRPFHAPVSSGSEEHWTEEYPQTRNPPGRPGAGSEDVEAEAGTLADRLALEESWDPLDAPTISMFDRIIEAEGDLDIFDKWSGQQVTESDGEDGDGSSGSSSENEQGSEDEETEMDI